MGANPELCPELGPNPEAAGAPKPVLAALGAEVGAPKGLGAPKPAGWVVVTEAITGTATPSTVGANGLTPSTSRALVSARSS